MIALPHESPRRYQLDTIVFKPRVSGGRARRSQEEREAAVAMPAGYESMPFVVCPASPHHSALDV